MPGEFLDREDALQALERAWASPKPVLALVWGRRRTGKTRLLGRFVGDKRAVFYVATQQASRTELRGFGGAIRDALHPSGSGRLCLGDLPDWTVVLDYLGQYARYE